MVVTSVSNYGFHSFFHWSISKIWDCLKHLLNKAARLQMHRESNWSWSSVKEQIQGPDHLQILLSIQYRPPFRTTDTILGMNSSEYWVCQITLQIKSTAKGKIIFFTEYDYFAPCCSNLPDMFSMRLWLILLLNTRPICLHSKPIPEFVTVHILILDWDYSTSKHTGQRLSFESTWTWPHFRYTYGCCFSFTVPSFIPKFNLRGITRVFSPTGHWGRPAFSSSTSASKCCFV
jgi:hypothetical protein